LAIGELHVHKISARRDSLRLRLFIKLVPGFHKSREQLYLPFIYGFTAIVFFGAKGGAVGKTVKHLPRLPSVAHGLRHEQRALRWPRRPRQGEIGKPRRDHHEQRHTPKDGNAHADEPYGHFVQKQGNEQTDQDYDERKAVAREENTR
jgi:hypothetical protein